MFKKFCLLFLAASFSTATIYAETAKTTTVLKKATFTQKAIWGSNRPTKHDTLSPLFLYKIYDLSDSKLREVLGKASTHSVYAVLAYPKKNQWMAEQFPKEERHEEFCSHRDSLNKGMPEHLR